MLKDTTYLAIKETTDGISDENAGNVRARKKMSKSEVEIWTEMTSTEKGRTEITEYVKASYSHGQEKTNRATELISNRGTEKEEKRGTQNYRFLFGRV